MSSWTFIARPHPAVEAIPAFDDNYLWLILGPSPSDPTQARPVAVVDPGDADAVNLRLVARHFKLAAILITHHHADHIGGLSALKSRWACEVYGPLDSRIEELDHVVGAGPVHVAAIDTDFEVIEVPGHTATHIAWYAKALGKAGNSISKESENPLPPVLFCGDTMFAAGCGRLFEGSPAQMQASLDRLASLPDATLVYCAHEYTLSNLKFARAAFPESGLIQKRLEEAVTARQQGQATVPSNMGIEKRSNPFLLCDDAASEPALVAADQWEVSHRPGRLERFTALRQWKNVFR